jgi:hypothetical protein
MKYVIAVVLTFTAFGAIAQQAEQPRSNRRAPLAMVEDVEPAVDVGEPRVALINPAPVEPPPTPPPETGITPAAPEQAVAEPARPTSPPAARVMDTLDLGTTSITGNSELPKVLYIVPWKKSDLGDLVGRPVNTLLDEVLAPVDPAVFERHLGYYDSMYGEREEE